MPFEPEGDGEVTGSSFVRTRVLSWIELGSVGFCFESTAIVQSASQ